MCPRRPRAGAPHDVDLGVILAQAHFVEQRVQIECGRWCTHPRARLSPDSREPALGRCIGFGACRQRHEERRLVGKQPWHEGIQAVDRMGFIKPEALRGSGRTKAPPVPDLAFFVFFAAKQNRTGVAAAGHDHDHGLGLGKATEVVKIAVAAVRIV